MIDTPSTGSVFAPDKRLVAVVLALAAVRLAMGGNIGLTDDEAYYRLWALAPALSYLDHPPMVAYMMALGRSMIGDSELGMRFVTVIAFAAGTAALWRTARILFHAGIANTACWFFIVMPLLAVGGIITTPDAPSVLFSGLVMWALSELHRSQNANWWLAVGAFAGLGLLSKYTNLFAGGTVLIWVLTRTARRHWVRTWQFWAAGAIAAALAAPVIIWNARHDWVSFAKQFGRVVRGHDASAWYLIEMAGGYFALASPLIAALSIFGFVHTILRAVRTQDASSTLVVASILPGLMYFAIHALHARVQANWLAPLYPPLAICAALALHAITSSRLLALARTMALGVGLVSVAAVYAHAVAPLPFAVLRKDPTHQMRGWQAFSEKVNALRIAQGAEWIATSSYATTGQLAFGLKSRTAVLQLNERIRYAHLDPVPASLTRAPGLYVELDRRANSADLQRRFHSVVKIADIARMSNGKPVASYAAFRVSDPKNAIFGP